MTDNELRLLNQIGVSIFISRGAALALSFGFSRVMFV